MSAGGPVVGYVAPIGAEVVAQRITMQRACNHRLFDVRCLPVREHDAARAIKDAIAGAAVAK